MHRASHVMTSALLSNSTDVLCRCDITVRGPVSSLKTLYPTIGKTALSGTRLSSGNLDSRHTHGRRSSGPAVKAGLLDFFNRGGREKQQTELKESLLESVKSLDRGADASPEDQDAVEAIVRKLESLNPTRSPLSSPLINGKWELVYTTSSSLLKENWKIPKAIRKQGRIYQCIDTNTLQARNIETWPLFNQVQATLTPLSSSRVAVKFDKFKIGGLIGVNAPDSARGELNITYLDEEMRIARGDKGNLFVLTMSDPDYTIEAPPQKKTEVMEA